jgi:regulator of protease activity HflC (stomatin/prohibitin superfamily)
MESTVLVVAGAVVATALATGIAVVRVVPAGHCGVVIRAGRATRLRRSGLVMVAPGIERIEMVALRPPPIDPLGVTTLTRDGVEVHLIVSVLWSVADPTCAVNSALDVRAATASAVERGLHHLIANVDLAHLLRDREDVLSQLPATTQPLAEHFGVEVIDVDLLDAELRVGPALLRLLT